MNRPVKSESFRSHLVPWGSRTFLPIDAQIFGLISFFGTECSLMLKVHRFASSSDSAFVNELDNALYHLCRDVRIG